MLYIMKHIDVYLKVRDKNRYDCIISQ